ncbi:MAG: shikimate dehydrogenase, partial [Planctomycetota bacterium]
SFIIPQQAIVDIKTIASNSIISVYGFLFHRILQKFKDVRNKFLFLSNMLKTLKYGAGKKRKILLAKNNRKFCISIARKTMSEALTDIKAAAKLSTFIEIRIDYIKNLNLKKLIATAKQQKCIILVTNRSKKEGGKFNGSERLRLSLLEQASILGTDFVDIELSSYSKFQLHGKSKLIVSYHNTAGMPSDLNQIYKSLSKTKADIIKIAVTANDFGDNLKMLELIEKSRKPAIAFCMGGAGIFSRVMSLSCGAPFTYVSLAKGLESAEGQLSFDEMSKLYKADKITRKTQIYGLVGYPVSQSIGAKFHNKAFSYLKWNAVYIPIEVHNLKSFISSLGKLNISGFSVTTPHKKEVCKYLKKLSPEVKSAGAANTIIYTDGLLSGYNTDGEGAIHALLEVVDTLKNKKCLILGAGATARAIACSLKKAGAYVVISNRTLSRGRKAAYELEVEFAPWGKREQIICDVVINATSAGFGKPDESAVTGKLFRREMVALDTVYFPAETKFMQQAYKKGSTIISGLSMYYYQAIRQLELWHKHRIPEPVKKKLYLSSEFCTKERVFCTVRAPLTR